MYSQKKNYKMFFNSLKCEKKDHRLFKEQIRYNVLEMKWIRNTFMETKNTTEKNINLLWQQ